MGKVATITSAIPAVPETLTRIRATIEEIRAIRNMDHKVWLATYVSPEGRAALDRWERIRQKCWGASELARKQVSRRQPTEADGLPHEYVVLLQAQAQAEETYKNWDKGFQSLGTLARDPQHLGFDPTTSLGCTLSQLAEAARKKTIAGKEAACVATYEIKHKLEPKEREGTIVRRVRQQVFRAYSIKEAQAGKVAYEKAMKKWGGHAAERAANAARANAEDAQQADINKLGKRLEVELQAYLLVASLPPVKLECPERVTGEDNKEHQCGEVFDSRQELSDHLFHRHGRGIEREETVKQVWDAATAQSREGTEEQP